MRTHAHIVTLALVAVAGVLGQGCGDARRRASIGDAPTPHIATITTWGAALRYPVWLELHPLERDAMLTEMVTTWPEADPRLPLGRPGVPSWATVVVVDGRFYDPSSPTGLAAGRWIAPTTIIVAWRGNDREPRRLPALAHELRHLLTQDPKAGH